MRREDFWASVVAISIAYSVVAAAYALVTAGPWKDARNGERARHGKRLLAFLFLLFPVWPVGLACHLLLASSLVWQALRDLFSRPYLNLSGLGPYWEAIPGWLRWTRRCPSCTHEDCRGAAVLVRQFSRMIAGTRKLTTTLEGLCRIHATEEAWNESRHAARRRWER